MIILIKTYKLGLSPYLGQNCRFQPGCASYAIQAIERFGLIHGSILAVKRIARCHPWHEGGYDPVPECNSSS